MSRSRTERRLLADDFASWCEAHPGSRVDLFVGAERLHSLLLPDDLPLPDDDAVQRYARLQFGHYFGPSSEAWPLACWTDGAERGVAALAEADGLAALQATAAARRVRIMSLRPTWALAPPEDGDWVVVDQNMLTWLQRREGRLVTLQQRPAGQEHLQELDGATVLHATALIETATPRTGPDFIRRRSTTAALVLAWAAAAAVACVLVGVQARDLADEAARLSEQAELLQRLAPPTAARMVSAPNPATRSRAWAAARQLDTDWATRWSEVERALPPDLQLFALDLDARSLRLEGQAPAADAVTQLVDRLALKAGPREEVVLTRLQGNEGGAGLRFELVRRPGGGLK